MKKDELLHLLKQTFSSLVEECENTDSNSFYKNKNEKWSAAQNFAHLSLSAKILNRGLAAPKIALWYKFGRKLKGKSKDYNSIVEIYKKANAIPRTQATGFEPRMKPDSSKESELKTFKELHERLIEIIKTWSENQLNSYLLPHPLLGKLTVKEMLYFTDYHIKHHQKAIKTAME